MDDLELATRVTQGDLRGIARALRMVDDGGRRAIPLLKALYPHTGRAYVLGITGNPGAGKSTLVDRLIEAYRAQGKTVAVIAVDPTSPFTGGAILGDRIRMQKHFLDEGVFIRSLATRGHLGGLSRSAGDAIHVLDAAGFDVVVVETVGVGQDELEITRHAHTTLVVVAPGLGDDIQAIKAGILEIADVFVVNKADKEGADATVRDLEQMMMLGEAMVMQAARHGTHGHGAARLDKKELLAGGRWFAPVVKCVATRNEGIAQIVEACDRHRASMAASQQGESRRKTRVTEQAEQIFRDFLDAAARERLASRLDETWSRVAARQLDPYTAAEELTLALFEKRGA